MTCLTKRKLRAEALLRRAGLRPTKQRLAIAEGLFGEKHHHVTADSLFAAVNRAAQPVSLATIYNTLEQFAKARLIRQIAIDASRSYFDTNTANHSHFYDEGSGRLIDIECPVTVTGLPNLPHGTLIRHIDIVVRLERVQD